MVLCISEHHRREADLNCISISGFVLASSYCRVKRKSKGGVCIFVRDNVSFKTLPKLKEMSIPYIFELCGIDLNGTYILCIYRPNTKYNDGFIDNMDSLFSFINKNKTRTVIACGDFNVDTLVNSNETKQFMCLLESFHLVKNIHKPTRITSHSRTCIDNIISTNKLNEARVIDLAISDHTLQYANLEIPFTQKTAYYNYIRDLNIDNLENMKTDLLNVSWDKVLKASDCDTGFNIFHDIITEAFDRYCPEIKIKCNSSSKDRGWITPGIKKSCSTKREMFIRAKVSENKEVHNRYRTYCAILNRVILHAKRSYNENKIINSHDIVKSTWNLINRNINGMKPVEVNKYVGLTDGVRAVTSENEAPDLFNDFFTYTGTGDKSAAISTPNISTKTNDQPSNPNTMFARPVTRDELFKTVMALKNKKSCGYDNIPTLVLKYIFDAIAEPLLFLVNLSLTEGIFPARLKKADIKPIHKKDDKLNVNNYRPVSLLITLSKIFEGIMASRLRCFLSLNQILAKEQFGFQKGSSTADAIFDIVDFVTEALDGKENVVSVLLDLSKAFDHVDHEILLNILERNGIRGIILSWFRSYLEMRPQNVILHILNDKKTLEKIESRTSIIQMGVPQGSILGPILFLLYINHLPCVIKQKIVMFADDVSVFFKFDRKDTPDLSATISDTIKIIIKWLKNIKLNTNISKTCILHFRNYNTPDLDLNITIDGKKIETVKSAKFLGIHFDDHLNWKTHIDVLENKLSSFCFALRCLSKITTKKATLQAYFAFFQSRVTYGLAMWGGCTDIKRIFILQKRCVRILENLGSNRISCRESFVKLRMHTVTALYIIELCKIVKRYPSKFPLRPEGISSRLNEKNKFNLDVPTSRTVTYDRTTKMAAIKFFNKLPDDIKRLNGNIFFNKLSIYLLKICPYNHNEFLNFK